MTDPAPKSLVSRALQALGNTISQRVVTALTLALVGFIATTGKGMVRSVYAGEVKSVMRPEIQSLQAQVDTLKDNTRVTEKKVDSVDSKVEKVDDKVDALISILVEAFPQVKKAAQERTQKNRDSQDVQDALTGDKP